MRTPVLDNLVLLLLMGLQRSVSGQLLPPRACGIQIVVDNFLWEHLISETNTEDRNEAERIARFNAASLAGRLVNRANSVLGNQFIGRVKYKLMLQDLKILSGEECGEVCENFEDLENLLNVFSYSSRDSYCLSYLLTYRSFRNGKLGLAFTASTFQGGVCETFRKQKEEVFGYEREINKSLNTGVVTFNRNERSVSEEVAGLTFSHEIGHSFGAPHDPAECSGDPKLGTFLMHKSGSLGNRKNNMLLSPCSIESMSSVLSSLELREGGTCWLLDSGRGTCGNSVVEVWEECDCGRDPEECERMCCVPPGDSQGRQACKLTAGAQCSPSEGVCCTGSCKYSPSTQVCSKEDECTKVTMCTGKNTYCPLPSPKGDGTSCAGGSKLCSSGQCTGSVCETFGMLACTPDSTADSTDCQPNCHAPHLPCSPANVSYPDGTECSLGEVYGYCGAGACLLTDGRAHQSWIVGVVIFIAFYLVLMLVGCWIYCRYCRRQRITLLPVKQSSLDSRRRSNIDNRRRSSIDSRRRSSIESMDEPETEVDPPDRVSNRKMIEHQTGLPQEL